MNFRFCSIQHGLHSSIPTINQLGIHSAHQENYNNPDTSQEISHQYLEGNSNPEETKVPFRDLNFSTDVSELFSFFEPDSAIFSKTQNSNKHSTETTEVKDNNVVNKSKKIMTNKESTKCNSSNPKNNGRKICMKSTETFPITDALKDVILDLDIGNKVRKYLKHKIIYLVTTIAMINDK